MRTNLITNGRFLASALLMGAALICYATNAQTTKTTTATNKENEMKAILTEEQFQKYQGVKAKVKTTAVEKLKKFKF